MVCLILLVMAAGFLTHSVMGRWVADLSGKVLTPLAERVGYGQAFVALLIGRGDLIQENQDLKTELMRAQAAVANFDELTQENKFLRSVVGLPILGNHLPVEAGVFGYIREGGLREAVVNKGENYGIMLGDIVIADSGALVGIVKDVSHDHSVMRMVGDPDFETTARIVGTDISGLLKVDSKEGLVLDLVQKNEKVSEGQSVATSGNDGLPAGILIGTVRSVDNESATLFKIVRISSAEKNFSGKVLIFHP